jgi:hypothetical protein
MPRSDVGQKAEFSTCMLIHAILAMQHKFKKRNLLWQRWRMIFEPTVETNMSYLLEIKNYGDFRFVQATLSGISGCMAECPQFAALLGEVYS